MLIGSAVAAVETIHLNQTNFQYIGAGTGGPIPAIDATGSTITDWGLDDNYILTESIDLTGITLSIGSGTLSNGANLNEFDAVDATSPFTGTFDGRDHIISNLEINEPTNDFVGLFNCAQDATFSNIRLIDVSVKGNTHVGSLLGAGINTTIENCSVNGGTVIAMDHTAGGLVGGTSWDGDPNKQIIRDSSASVTVTGDASGAIGHRMGGFIGNFRTGSLINCSASGNVTGHTSLVSGFVGFIGSNATVRNCHSSGNSVTGGASNVGGFAGQANGVGLGLTISDSYSTVDKVDGGGSTGGFIGTFSRGNISNCYATGSYVNSSQGDITVVTNSGGGFIGVSDGLVEISNSFTTIESVSGKNGVGGFIGRATSTSGTTLIQNCYTTSNVTSIASTLTTAPAWVGGFIGICINATSEPITIFDCYSTGIVNVEGSEINTIGSIVGGFCGLSRGTNVITNSYTISDIIGDGDSVGNFIGEITDSSISSSFYLEDNVKTATVTNSGGISKSESELKAIKTFTTDLGTAAWSMSSLPNANSIWYINEGNSYPLFFWAYTPSTQGGGSSTGGATISGNNNTPVAQPQNNATPVENNTTPVQNNDINNAPVNNPTTPVPESSDEKKPISTTTWLIIGAVLIIVAVAAVFGYRYYNENKD